MANFHCTVSTSRTRRPVPLIVVADDEAEAAFLASIEHLFPTEHRIWVHAVLNKRNSYRVTNGFTTYLVTVVSTT